LKEECYDCSRRKNRGEGRGRIHKGERAALTFGVKTGLGKGGNPDRGQKVEGATRGRGKQTKSEDRLSEKKGGIKGKENGGKTRGRGGISVRGWACPDPSTSKILEGKIG